MTFWFLDASVLLAREDADDDQHEAARELLAGDATLATLDLAYYEVGNVAVRAWRDVQAAARLKVWSPRSQPTVGWCGPTRRSSPTP